MSVAPVLAADPIGIGVHFDPSSGQVLVEQPLAVAVGVLVWLACVVLGLLTAWLVMP